MDAVTLLLYAGAALSFSMALFCMLRVAIAASRGMGALRTLIAVLAIGAIIFVGVISFECAHARRKTLLFQQNGSP